MANGEERKKEQRENLIKIGIWIASLVSFMFTLNLAGLLYTLFTLIPENETTLSPAPNYGSEDTWYHLVTWDEINYEGDRDILVVSGAPQGECRNIKNYRDVPDAKSVELYDRFNPDSPLPEGTQVHLFWGKECPDWKPHGVITVPANAKEIRVPRLNHPTPNYEVFNNFQQQDGGDRKLNGHVHGIRWSIP